MSRLHTVRASVADIARHFDAEAPTDLIVPEETKEGLPGLVIIERDGQRFLRTMEWGFPRAGRAPSSGESIANRVGMVANLTSPMWDKMVVDPRYRCLIVLTHFANPLGIPGAKTRAWFSVRGQPIVAWAGFCRSLPEIGPVYAGMTMDANAAIPPTNDRMPVLLDPYEYDRWLRCSVKDVIWFQHRPPFEADRIKVDYTEDLWNSGAAPPATERQFALL